MPQYTEEAASSHSLEHREAQGPQYGLKKQYGPVAF